jgi:hypothetical protein
VVTTPLDPIRSFRCPTRKCIHADTAGSTSIRDSCQGVEAPPKSLSGSPLLPAQLGWTTCASLDPRTWFHQQLSASGAQDPGMGSNEALDFLHGLLGKPLRVTINDGRLFNGRSQPIRQMCVS